MREFGSKEFRDMLFSAIELYYKYDDFRIPLLKWNQLDLFLTKYNFDGFLENYDVTLEEYKTFIQPTIKLIDKKVNKRIKKAIKNGETVNMVTTRYPFSVEIVEGDIYES